MHHSVFGITEGLYLVTPSVGVKTTLGLKRKLIMDRWLELWMNEVMTNWEGSEGENRDTALLEVA